MKIKNIGLNDSYTTTILIALIVGYFFSFALGAFIFFIGSISIKKINNWGYFFYIFLISIVAFTNYSDINEGNYDINRYYSYYILFYDCRTIPELLMLLYNSRDTLFYIIVWCSTFILPSDPRWFSFFFTFVTSSLLFLTFRNYAIKLFREDITRKLSSLIFFCLGFFCLIRFVDFTNGYRQHFAFALFLFITSLNINKTAKAVLLFITGFVHSSNFLIAMFYYILIYSGIYRKPQQLYFYSIIFSLMISSILIFILGSDNYFVSYLLGNEELGIDNRMRLNMLLSTSLFFILFRNILVRVPNLKKNDVLVDLQCLSSTFLVVSIVFITRSTLIIRFAFDWTDCIVVFTPIVYNLLNKQKAIGNNVVYLRYVGIGKYALKLTWILFIIYNLLKICDGSFEYKLFSEYGVFASIQNVFASVIPEGLI